MKKLIIMVIITLCIGLSYLFPHEMLNPGELVGGHQDLSNKCLSCHTAFSGILNSKCISCHKLTEIGKDSLQGTDSTGSKTKPLFHRHLSGQECASCHTDHKGMNPGILISSFQHEMLSQGILANCVSCHQKPTDEYHQLLKTGCNECHSTSKWVPSTFDHSKYFLLDNNHNATCNTCHSKSNYFTYTCYSCHEHSESNIISKHNEEGIFNISNCVSCHKSGDEDGIRNGNESNQKDMNEVKDYLKKLEKGRKNGKDDD